MMEWIRKAAAALESLDMAANALQRLLDDREDQLLGEILDLKAKVAELEHANGELESESDAYFERNTKLSDEHERKEAELKAHIKDLTEKLSLAECLVAAQKMEIEQLRLEV